MEKTRLGKRLKELRTKYRYTQADIAAFLGVDQSFISKYESGERQISVDMLEKLGDLYGCDFVHSPATVSPLRQAAFGTNSINASNMRAFQAVNCIVLNSVSMVDLLNEDG